MNAATTSFIKRNFRLFILFIITALPTLQIQGQPQMYFQAIRQGLSNQSVRCIFKDSRGFMWFGTHNGLTRYDGINFVNYENSPTDSNTLNNNYIRDIVEDKWHNIWVATFQGLNRYNRQKDNFTRITPVQNIIISAMSLDNQNNLWFGDLGTGFMRYNIVSKEVEYFRFTKNKPNWINSDHVTSLIPDNKGKIWIGTWNGLDILDVKTKGFRHIASNTASETSLSNNCINTMILDKNGILWIGLLNGELNSVSINDPELKFKNYQFGKDVRSISPQNIISLCFDNSNKLWIGTENVGLICYNIKNGDWSHYSREEGNNYTLSSNTIRALYFDDLNFLWVGTLGRGVNYLNVTNNRFNPYKKNLNTTNTLAGEDVRSFAQDPSGNIWIATYNGLSLFDLKTRNFIKTINQANNGLSSNAVNALTYDSEGNLWVGTLRGGVDRFDKNLKKTGNYAIKGFQQAGENKILCLYSDPQDNIWAGSAGTGMFRYDKQKNVFVQVKDTTQEILTNNIGYVNDILRDSYGKMWVATAFHLYCLTGFENYNYRIKEYIRTNTSGAIPSNTINTVYEDRDKNLWLGTLDQGLALYNRDKDNFTVYNKKDGLPGNSVYGILEDKSGNLWISTNKGLSRFNKSEKKFKNYNTEDGIVSDEFITNCCLKTRDGEMMFGSNEGFNIFYPENIKDKLLAKQVYLTDFKISNKSVPIGTNGSPLSKCIGETKKIVLTYNQSSFTIDFVAFNYTLGSKSRYSYILEGLEKDWNIVSHKNNASYTYVKPGSYYFKVKGSNNDGVWNENPTVLEIVILPPFWETGWAYCIYLTIFAFIVFAFIRYRITRLKEIHLIELNKMKLQFFANVSHELRTPLSLILSPLDSLLNNIKDNQEIRRQLELISNNANRLFRLVNEIMDFSKAEENKLVLSVQSLDIVKFSQQQFILFRDEALRRGIDYQFMTIEEEIEAWIDGDKYEKIIMNLLSNAFKFTPNTGKISLSFEKILLDRLKAEEHKNIIPKITAKEYLKISVIDNGKGIASSEINKIFERFFQGSNDDFTYQTGTGIGLSLTKSLVELHHGTISVTSEKGVGTCFTIILPLGKTHFKKHEFQTKPALYNLIPAITQSNSEIFKTEKKSPPKNAPVILIVEDNFELRNYVKSSFSEIYQVLEASDGEEGCRIAEEKIPDLIISDIIMPNLSGIELCRNLKHNMATSHIPIILLTAKITTEDQIAGVETGADAYITKPFNVKYLEVVTKNLIETRQKLYQRFSQDVYILPKEISNNPLDQDFLENIIKYIEDHIISTDLTVENLANHLLMSPGHTWRKLKSLTGQSTNEFIRTIRLKKAVKLMEESHLNVSEIAYQVGFSSPAYFTKCFREQYGKSPSAYFSEKK
jgi:signal transduction histidine kinase/ligand-binding sensor domain-containing protein/DNA-binding response OmpR family regulator